MQEIIPNFPDLTLSIIKTLSRKVLILSIHRWKIAFLIKDHTHLMIIHDLEKLKEVMEA